ncbi:hypothetical protein GIW26_15995 [Pseudomonas syringae]|uniref:hypothetical protein n=1 Tax=Pseudomonas syringae TaxID=317 RepID=UPI001F231BD7|nr:hypothetical protein [Pseudomonas syringae]MCF8985071.1 hypothetical protein [Pseudomonas syringae]
MEPTADVSPPDDPNSGVSGEQQPGDGREISATPPPLEGQLLQSTFMGLVSNSPDRYGGAQNAPIIGALIHDFAYDKEQARSLAAEKQRLLDLALNELTEQKLINVRLEERLKQSADSNRIQKVCLFLGPVLLAIAIDLFKANFATLACIVAVVGISLILTAVVSNIGKN